MSSRLVDSIMDSAHKIFVIGAIATYITMGAMGPGMGVGLGVRAQNFYNASIRYENITFDMVNRGSYNISYCIESLLSCWESVKPDTICYMYYYYQYTSVCELMRELCYEFSGEQDALATFYLKDSLCTAFNQVYRT